MITRNDILGLRDTVGIGYANELLGLFDHLEAARKTLEESERGRKANEHSMLSYMSQCDYLKEQRDDLAIKLHASNAVIAALNIRVEDLSKELAALRPPEPKFKPGQLVVSLEYTTVYRLQKRRPSWITDEWRYYIEDGKNAGNYVCEKDVREQTAQEKGE